MDNDTKENLSNRNIWARGLYMLFFAFAYGIAEAITTLIALFQFVYVLLTGKVHRKAQTFAATLGAYILQIVQYETFNSELQPFPFSDWPETKPGETPWPLSESTAPSSPTVEEGDTDHQVAAQDSGGPTAEEDNDNGDQPK